MKKTRKPEAPRGAILRPSAAISEEYSAAVLRELERMHKETVRVISQVWRDAPPVMDSAMDASAGSQARIALNALTTKYDAIFKRLAKRASERMISRTLRNSSVTLAMSLKEVAKEITLDTYFLTDRLNEIVTASTQEAANLIKLIPQRYLGAVQGEVMRSITAGNGLQDLVPQLTARYQGPLDTPDLWRWIRPARHTPTSRRGECRRWGSKSTNGFTQADRSTLARITRRCTARSIAWMPLQ